MNKSEYVSKVSALEHTRQKALEYNRKEVEKLSKQYIADNCKLQVGDFVQLDNTKGQITDLDACLDGSFIGQWRKVKKNGELYAVAYAFSPNDYDKMVRIEFEYKQEGAKECNKKDT